MTSSTLLLLAVFLPFAGAAVAPFAARVLRSQAGLLLAACFLPGLALVTLSARARAGVPATAQLEWVETLGLTLAFRADGFSLFFSLIVAGVGALVLAYASSYLAKQERFGRFYSYLLLFGGAMLGLVLADNLVALFCFWELTSISSFLLIGFWDSRKASQDGAFKALLITAGGGLALMAGVILLMLAGATTRLSELEVAAVQASPYFVPAIALCLLAAFTKSAQLPFHLWLPTAMEAPTPVSAYLHSATMVKAGVVLVAKLGFLLAGTPFQTLVLYVGLATMFWGSYLALRQHDLKALLAYSTVSQLGILMALYGSGHAFAATAHLLNHAAFKAALFLVVGIIDHEAGTRDLRKLSGLYRKLPITFAIAVPAALSMAGLPPFGGFISKELFYEAMLHEGFLPTLIAVTGSMMTFAYSFLFLKVFIGPYQAEDPHVHEAPPELLLPALPLSFGALLLGLYPAAGEWFTNLAASGLGYKPYHLSLWHGFNLALGLSVLTWLGGAGLVYLLPRFVALQMRLTPRWNANTVFYAVLRGLEYSAYFIIRHTQGASFSLQLRLILLPFALGSFIFGFSALPPLVGLTPVPLEFSLLALLTIASAGGTLMARHRLSALIFMGLAGFALTLAFVLLRAPDLALTQLLIETVSVLLFLSVFRYLPLLTRYERKPGAAAFDMLLSLAAGVTVFVTLLAVQIPIGERLGGYFLEAAKPLGGGYNVVNVILVDFRGYDTLGEITVLAVVGIAVYALLKLRPFQGTEGEDEA